MQIKVLNKVVRRYTTGHRLEVSSRDFDWIKMSHNNALETRHFSPFHVSPTFKKSTLDKEVFKNFKPIFYRRGHS